MNTCPQIGESFYYLKKRYVCKKAKKGCHGCDFIAHIGTPDDFCNGMKCKHFERPDRTPVIFRLQPKHRKEDVK